MEKLVVSGFFVVVVDEILKNHLFFSSIDFLEVSTFFRGTLLLFSLDFDDIFKAVAGEEGTGIFVSFTDDVDENGWS